MITVVPVLSCKRKHECPSGVMIIKNSLFVFVLVHELDDLVVGVQKLAHGALLVGGADDIRAVLRHICFDKPRLLTEFLGNVSQVGGDDRVEQALLVRVAELGETLGEETEGRGKEDAVCALLLSLNCYNFVTTQKTITEERNLWQQ